MNDHYTLRRWNEKVTTILPLFQVISRSGFFRFITFVMHDTHDFCYVSRKAEVIYVFFTHLQKHWNSLNP